MQCKGGILYFISCYGFFADVFQGLHNYHFDGSSYLRVSFTKSVI